MIQEPNVTNRISQFQLPSSLDREDLRRLFKILQERLNAAADLEVANFKKFDQTDVEYEKNKGILREGYQLRPTIIGQDGLELFGSADQVLASPNFPDSVRSAYVNSGIFLKVTQNFSARNSVEFYLDFSRPGVFDFTLMPSSRTPNGSNMTVQGADPMWVNGLSLELQKFFQERPSSASWIHGHTVYDLFLWLIGFPAAFWVCFSLSPRFPKPDGVGAFFRAALFVYTFLLVLVGFRTMFHYGRWVFPLTEFRHPKDSSMKHRIALVTLGGGIATGLIYDVFKGIFIP